MQAGNVRFGSAVADTSLLVNPATLTYAADPLSLTYGTTVGTLTGTRYRLGQRRHARDRDHRHAGVHGPTPARGPASAAPPSPAAGCAATNYVFTQADGNASALTVTPAELRVTALDATGQYGQPTPALNFTTTGLVAGDTPAVALDGNSRRGRRGRRDVPDHARQPSAPRTTPSRFAPATLSVTPAALTIRPADANADRGDAEPGLHAGLHGSCQRRHRRDVPRPDTHDDGRRGQPPRHLPDRPRPGPTRRTTRSPTARAPWTVAAKVPPPGKPGQPPASPPGRAGPGSPPCASSYARGVTKKRHPARLRLRRRNPGRVRGLQRRRRDGCRRRAPAPAS